MDVSGTMPVSTWSAAQDPESLLSLAHTGDAKSLDAVTSNFESMFMSMVLKEMRQTLGPEGLFGNDSSDIYGGLFDLYLGQHMARSGGFGMAQVLKRQLGSAQKS
jgi:Rod binding domain-containing protein